MTRQDTSAERKFRALRFARQAHHGQFRRYTDEPYWLHPRRVAQAVQGLELSEEAIIAAYLHDVVEDCGITLDQIREEFGEKVCYLVDLLSDLQTPEDGNRAHRKRVYADRLSRYGNFEAQTIKCEDLIDNAVSIKQHDEKFWPTFRQEALYLLSVLSKAHETSRSNLAEVLGV